MTVELLCVTELLGLQFADELNENSDPIVLLLLQLDLIGMSMVLLLNEEALVIEETEFAPILGGASSLFQKLLIGLLEAIKWLKLG